MKSTQTLVLTSKENYVWSSMQEIIPHLERCWLKSANENHNVELVDVDNLDLKKITKLAWNANNIVLTCFNIKTVKIAVFLRQELGLNFRIIFHLHNQATIGLWPLQEFGLLKLLKGSDLFISSCQRDWETLLLTCPKAQGAFIPFTLSDAEIKLMTQWHDKKIKKEFYFVGRISRQKNIHFILKALALLKNEFSAAHFHIFGEEDNLGSPNMGMSDLTYMSELQKQIIDLDLSSMVTFHGHKERTSLYGNILKERFIFISMSAHSDENFGMAAYRALLRGEPTLLSDWGGHSDFMSEFKDQVSLVPIIHKKNELGIDEAVLVNSIKEALRKDNFQLHSKNYYLEENLAGRYNELATSKLSPVEHLELSDLSRRVFLKREVYKELPTKVFDSYEDPLVQPFFISYGLKGKL